MTTKTKAKVTDPVTQLPEAVQEAMKVVSNPQNSKEEAGTHLNPRMGRLSRAFRSLNGNISQVKVAKGDIPGFDNQRGALTTTHCQIATLEQGGCKKGADAATVKLFAEALGVSEDVITAINAADLHDRAEKGDKLAQKILGVADEADATPDEVASKTPDSASSTGDVPEPAKV